MSRPFTSVALDYDGTLTETGRPGEDTLAAMAEARAAGLYVVLVTGRILAELRGVFPAVEDCVDAIVAENGAVLWTPRAGVHALAPPVSAALEAALRHDRAPVRRGLVLLASAAEYDLVVERHIGRLGLEEQVVRNRGELMVLPAGVTKGSGLRRVLADLGVSAHDAVGIGDAENDHSLLDACELGVAVANAVPALRERADLVLPEADGAGVARFLRGPALAGADRRVTHHWRVRLGTYADGTPTTLPASGINLLVTGGSGTGKSCLAGLLAERLADLGYCLLVLDPEGDHAGLGAQHGFVLRGGAEDPPGLHELAHLLEHKFGSVVVDLSQRPLDERRSYCAHVLRALEELRSRHGLPHWLVVDEAHLLFGGSVSPLAGLAETLRGLCLVTYHPSELPAEVLRAMDRVVALTDTPDLVPFVLRALGDGAPVPAAAPAAVSEADAGDAAGGCPAAEAPRTALLIDHDTARPFTLDRRATPHVRHWHKYLERQLPWHLRFFFQRDGEPAVAAGNLAELRDAVAAGDDAALGGHIARGDLSRWVREVLRDVELARTLAAIERAGGTPAAHRRDVLAALERRLPPR